MSTPSLRKETDDKFNQSFFVAASKLIFKYCPWIWFGKGKERKNNLRSKYTKIIDTSRP